MAYTALPSTQVETWDGDYNDLTNELANENDERARRLIEREMATLGGKIEKRLILDMGKVQGYYNQHVKKVDLWLAEALKLGKTAEGLVSKYKANPQRTEYVAQIKLIHTRLGTIDQAITDDANDMGAAWFQYRAGVATHTPAKYKAKFLAMRSIMINDSKSLSVKQQKVVTTKRQVKALLAITDKAKLKTAIKAGTGTDRPIATAQQLATDLVARELKLLTELRDPPGLQSKPYTLETTAPLMENSARDKNIVLDNQMMISYRGSIANAVSAVKLMETRLAAMTKIYDSTKKGLRSTELQDATVKAQLAQAAQHVADAKTDIKTTTGYLKRMKAALAKLEAAYKAQQRKK